VPRPYRSGSGRPSRSSRGTPAPARTANCNRDQRGGRWRATQFHRSSSLRNNGLARRRAVGMVLPIGAHWSTGGSRVSSDQRWLEPPIGGRAQASSGVDDPQFSGRPRETSPGAEAARRPFEFRPRPTIVSGRPDPVLLAGGPRPEVVFPPWAAQIDVRKILWSTHSFDSMVNVGRHRAGSAGGPAPPARRGS